jgi:hypothetical protein
VPVSTADGKKSSTGKIAGSRDDGSTLTGGKSVSGFCRESSAPGQRQGAVAGQLMTFLTMRFANDDNIKLFSQCDSDIRGMFGLGER